MKVQYPLEEEWPVAESNVWEKTVPLTSEKMQQLARFITQPDTRQHDILMEETYEVNASRSLQWLIKHDLFEGVGLYLTLMDPDTMKFLAGTQAALANPEDLAGDYEIGFEGETYRVHFTAR